MMTPQQGLEVLVLGPTLARDGSTDLRVDRPMERALLVRLAMARGVAVPDERLAVDLWGESGVERAAQRLRVVAFRLRTALGPYGELVVRTPAGYRVGATVPDLVRAESATERMHAAIRAGDHERARDAATSALAAWRGPSIADVRSIPFAGAEGQRLDGWRLEIVVHRLRAELELGGAAQLTTELAGLAAEHPLHEPIGCLLALALYRSGRQADALDRLARLRRALADELGVDPTPDTADLELRLLRQDASLMGRHQAACAAAPRTAAPGARARTRFALPVPTTTFVGRDAEMTALLAALDAPRLTTLVGGPGSGKSRLALEGARRVADSGRPVAFVELAPLRRQDSVETAAAAATGVDPRDGEPLTRVAAALGDGLLVLDNAEHLVDQVATVVATLRRAAPSLGVLVTSQRPMLVNGETLHRIGPLAVSDATALLVARVGDAAATAPADVATICAAVDGLPLGIELAAGLTRTLTLPQLATRMTDRLRLLVGGARDAGTRHTSLRAALDWSNELLDPVAQAVLRRVGVFSGGFDLDAAEQVAAGLNAAGSNVEPGAVAPALADLADRSLVTVVDGVVDGVRTRRFTLLGTVRDYALAQLHAHGETDAALARHLSWSLAYVRGWGAINDFATAETVSAVFAEWPNLLAALDRAAGTPRAGDGMRLAIALHRPWVVRGWFGEAYRHFVALADAGGLDAYERGRALANHGFHALMIGKFGEAGGLLAAASNVADTVDDASLVLRVQYQQGFIDYERCRLTEAIATLEAGEELARRLGHRRHVWAYTSALGTAHLYAGDVAAALAHFRSAVEMARERGDESGVARGLSDLARATLEGGRTDDALALVTESDHFARRLDDRQVLPRNELIRGAAALSSGQLDVAERHCRAALAFGDGTASMAHVDLADVLVTAATKPGGPVPGAVLDEPGALLAAVYQGAAERGTTWLAARPVSAALLVAAGDVDGARRLVQQTAADHATAGFGWPHYVARLAAVAAPLGEQV